MAEQINKDRLNELLGIQEGQSFDDYINAGNDMPDTQSVIDQTAKLIEETKQKVDEIDEEFQSNLQTIDNAQLQLKMQDANGSASDRIDTLVNVESAFKSIEDLVDSTKQMLANVYTIISSCDVLDSETVSAAASLIGETRQLISEYTGLYKQRVKFFDNVKMEELKQKNRLELLERKHQLDIEKYNIQHPATPAEAVEAKSGDGAPPGMVEYDTDATLKMLAQLDEEDEEIDEFTED